MYRCLTYLRWSGRVGLSGTYDILLRWSKEVSVLCVAFVALNISEIPRISHVELTFEKIVQSLAVVGVSIM